MKCRDTKALIRMSNRANGIIQCKSVFSSVYSVNLVKTWGENLDTHCLRVKTWTPIVFEGKIWGENLDTHYLRGENLDAERSECRIGQRALFNVN